VDGLFQSRFTETVQVLQYFHCTVVQFRFRKKYIGITSGSNFPPGQKIHYIYPPGCGSLCFMFKLFRLKILPVIKRRELCTVVTVSIWHLIKAAAFNTSFIWRGFLPPPEYQPRNEQLK
jgi:hypothetical protein